MGRVHSAALGAALIAGSAVGLVFATPGRAEALPSPTPCQAFTVAQLHAYDAGDWDLAGYYAELAEQYGCGFFSW
jgi:hypothetical protein